MTNPINRVRLQRPLAALFLVLVLAGLVAGAARALHTASTVPQSVTKHHAESKSAEPQR